MTKLEANHPWMQEGAQNFRTLLQEALQKQRSDAGLNDLMTQEVLRELGGRSTD